MRSSKKGIFIVIEGIDGSGKATPSVSTTGGQESAVSPTENSTLPPPSTAGFGINYINKKYYLTEIPYL